MATSLQSIATERTHVRNALASMQASLATVGSQLAATNLTLTRLNTRLRMVEEALCVPGTLPMTSTTTPCAPAIPSPGWLHIQIEDLQRQVAMLIRHTECPTTPQVVTTDAGDSSDEHPGHAAQPSVEDDEEATAPAPKKPRRRF